MVIVPVARRECKRVYVTEDEGFWSLELGVVLANIAAVHRQRGTTPRPPLAIAETVRRGRVRRRVPWPEAGQPVFGGVEDGGAGEDGGPRRRGGGDPLLRVRVKVEGYVINHRTPAPEEAASVLARLDGLMLLVLQLLAVTGARVASICAVREGDLDEIRGLLIPDTKTGPRWFPVPADLATSLKEHFAMNEGPLVAGSPTVAPQIVRDRLKRACKAAGVKPFTPHGFRRMVVDRMIRGGIDPATAASLTGHSVEVMLRYYREVTDEDRRLAVLKAGLGHFPLPGKVLEGPWDEQGQAAAAGSGPDRGTESGHNHGN